MISAEARSYLKTRCYTDEMLKDEEVFSLSEGEHFIEGIRVSVEGPSIGWISRAMSGHLIGIQTRRLDMHLYRWAQADKAQHLPIIYGSRQDFDILYTTGKMMMTEGIFDRGAMKRCFPEYAVFARLSKGVAKQLLVFVQRYSNVVWLAFDQDEPGQKATETAEQRLQGKVEVNTLNFPYKDPAKFMEKRGEAHMRTSLKKQIRALEI